MWKSGFTLTVWLDGKDEAATFSTWQVLQFDMRNSALTERAESWHCTQSSIFGSVRSLMLVLVGIA